jgi:hypothetical protein
MAQNIIRKLSNDLILRNATTADTEELIAFNSEIHKDVGEDAPDEFVAAWVRDLMTKPHPTTKPSDFIVVVDSKTKRIVSSMNLIPQTWSYEGIEFEVGRPELVGTAPEYRRKGLIREQFKVIHKWSSNRGHKMQAITGIPNYYRQFGYEMCLNLGGSREGHRTNIPKLKRDEDEQFIFRPAKVKDIPFISDLYQNTVKRSLISCVRGHEIWKYELVGRSKTASSVWLIIQSTDGESVGFVQHAPKMWNSNITVWGYELKPGISYLKVTPSLLRYLEIKGQEFAKKNEKIEFQGYSFSLGASHPVYEALPERMPRVKKPYTWYIRIPDIADFIFHIRSVLEKRLSESPACGYTGDLKICFYKNGLKLVFRNGSLLKIDPYIPEHSEDGDVFFPNLSFLQAVVGYRTFEELREIYPDCYAENDHGRALAKFLFLKKPSDLWMIN